MCELGIASPSRKDRLSVGKRFFLDLPSCMQLNAPQELLFTASESTALDQLLCMPLGDGIRDATLGTKRSSFTQICQLHVRQTNSFAGLTYLLCNALFATPFHPKPESHRVRVVTYILFARPELLYCVCNHVAVQLSDGVHDAS